MKFPLLLLCALIARADTIKLFSGDATGYNNYGANVLIAPHPVWSSIPGAQWVSFENTGNGGVALPYSSGPVADFYDFFTTSGAGDGWLWILADDTARVTLDGQLLAAANFNLGVNCAAGQITCVGNPLAIPFSFGPGQHTFEFDVFQGFAQGPNGEPGADIDWATFGVDYKADIAYQPITPTPEPIAFPALALIAGLLFVRQRILASEEHACGASESLTGEPKQVRHPDETEISK